MFDSSPVLCVALDAVQNVRADEVSIGGLWSVFTKVSSSVVDGRRLENITWRLWHRARVAPKPPSFFSALPRCPETLPRPLSSPSLSSSSEGTGTSSDWDRDTAVGDDDDLLHVAAPRLHSEKALLNLALGTRFLQDPPPFRLSPSAPSDATPHQPPHAYFDAGRDACRARSQGISLSASRHHAANPPHPIAGQHPSAHASIPAATSSAHHSALLQTRAPTDSRTSATVPPSSMPAILPPLTRPRNQSLSVGRIIADLFPDNVVLNVVQNMARSDSELRDPADLRSPQTPSIVEPQQPSTPPAASAALHRGNSPPSNSAATSTTSTPRQVFPTVVIVNPTPHPTPPATPSPHISEVPIGRDCPDRNPQSWQGSPNIQLATPVSVSGCARSPEEPSTPQPPQALQSCDSIRLDSETSIPTPLLPAAAIALPEKPTDHPISSHLATPSSADARQPSEMVHSSKSPPAPIPPPDDKKFFLAATLSGGSCHGSSESPSSLGAGSVSPDKAPSHGVPMHAGLLLGARDAAPQTRHLPRDEDLPSSLSPSSLSAGRPASVTSSRGGSMMSSRLKGRAGVSAASGSRRRPGAKKVAVVTKQEPKKDEAAVAKSKELEDRTKGKGKGKERAVGEPGSGSLQGSALKQSPNSQQRPQAPTQSQNLRQLPTNPPRQQLAAARRPSPRDHAHDAHLPPPPPNLRHLPFHPQLGHLGLGHLPTVPPRQRRAIEITETSSEYETTDTDGEESSWESESCSGDEAGEGDAQSTREGKGKATTSGGTSNNRTRDAGEFARDAALEAQRQREMFQKLPARSYSHLGQLPRTKSGLSLLFRPDPALFPEGHPYRTTRSSHDILARNWSAPAPPLAVSAAMSRRSAAAEPMAAPVHATSVASSGSAAVVSKSSPLRGSAPPRYRPKGKPAGQEDETDSGTEDPEDAVQVPNSVVQRRLAAIMGQRARGPVAARSNLHVEAGASPHAVSRPIATRAMMHPYLPDPAPLQTPHTVRRNIISQELDEELRRNLLWERSQNQILGRPPRAPGSILPGPWRPLATLTPEAGREAGRETEAASSDRGPGQRPFATQRTKSWAGDYHASGW